MSKPCKMRGSERGIGVLPWRARQHQKSVQSRGEHTRKSLLSALENRIRGKAREREKNETGGFQDEGPPLVGPGGCLQGHFVMAKKKRGRGGRESSELKAVSEAPRGGVAQPKKFERTAPQAVARTQSRLSPVSDLERGVALYGREKTHQHLWVVHALLSP
jgi:hypothetical protein